MSHLADVRYLPLGKGMLAISQRPSLTAIIGCRVMADRIVTLLKDSEHAGGIGKLAQAADYEWTHFPMTAWRVYWDYAPVQSIAQQVKGFLDAGETVFIHCGAGIHRSGTVAVNVMKLYGLSRAQAGDKLREMRPEVHEFQDWR